MAKPKLTDDEKAEIRRLHDEENVAYIDLAEMFHCSYRTIFRIFNPDKYKKDLEANRKYQKRNAPRIQKNLKEKSQRYALTLNVKTHADVVAKLNDQDNVQGYIVGLIRDDITNGENSVEVETDLRRSLK